MSSLQAGYGQAGAVLKKPSPQRQIVMFELNLLVSVESMITHNHKLVYLPLFAQLKVSFFSLVSLTIVFTSFLMVVVYYLLISGPKRNQAMPTPALIPALNVS